MHCRGPPTNSFLLPSTSLCFSVQISSLLFASPPISCCCRRRGRLLPLPVPRLRPQSGRSTALLEWGNIWGFSPDRVVPRAPSLQENVRRNTSPPLVVMSLPSITTFVSEVRLSGIRLTNDVASRPHLMSVGRLVPGQ